LRSRLRKLKRIENQPTETVGIETFAGCFWFESPTFELGSRWWESLNDVFRGSPGCDRVAFPVSE
jgi:hypothetical protein